MFDNRYYRNKYVCMPNDDTYALMEVNSSRKEAYIFIPTETETEIYLRDFIRRPIKDHEYIVSLKSFFEDRNIDDSIFKNPFTRTKKIISTLQTISVEKDKTLKK